ncbi:vWA domain-containing protein [Sinorhizobium sp. BG8]|uniref:vWA domain-containing protein n=1 Tax=Sinorhizobium sp. BG8 TaxID=2613773 RepID=UPI0032B26E14
MIRTKANLQDATDAAALAAAAAMTKQGFTAEAAKLLAMNFLKTQMGSTNSVDGEDEAKGDGGSDIDSNSSVTVTETALEGGGKSYKVEVSAKYDFIFNPLTQLFGQESTTLNAESTAESGTESKNALSMYFVLDRSGSMAEDTSTKTTYTCYDKKGNAKTCTGYLTKMESLKLATADLLTQMKTADPTETYVRTAAISYNSAAQTPTAFAWGTSGVLSYVNALTASGNTDSSTPFKTAYQTLATTAEDTAHKNKANNGQVPTKYIVFMTDGDNTSYNGSSSGSAGTSADTETKKWCDKARTDKMEVYTIAFMAPTRGQTLLKYCATTTSHYFAAESATDLIAAFKYIGQQSSAVVARLTK